LFRKSENSVWFPVFIHREAIFIPEFLGDQRIVIVVICQFNPVIKYRRAYFGNKFTVSKTFVISFVYKKGCNVSLKLHPILFLDFFDC